MRRYPPNRQPRLSPEEMKAERKRVLDLLGLGALSSSEICTITRIPRKRMDNHIGKLQDTQSIVRKNGKYQLYAEETFTLPDWPVMALVWAGYPVDRRCHV
jgi:hypothetical protein